MNLCFVRLGKVWAAIRSEGFACGVLRALRSIVSLLRFPSSADILFVASGTGDSARYRCHHVAEFLRRQGFSVTVSVQGNVFLSQCADRFSVVVFHRTSWTASVEKLLHELKRLKKTVIFDTDDLVFDIEAVEASSAFCEMNPLERKQYAHGAGAEFVADPCIEVATSATHFLAEKLREHGKRVFVVPNRLCEKDIQIAENIQYKSETYKKNIHEIKNSNTVTIGYFSGAKGHDRHFADISQVLCDLLEKYAQLHLFLAGPLTLPEDMSKYTDRITRSHYVPRAENFANMACVDIAIAPLEIGDPFCESKSELKFFEAGIVSTPIVASATDTFHRAITNGADGFLATTKKDWFDILERLIVDAELRKTVGEQAKKTVLARYTTLRENEDDRKYIRFLKERI